ncbi:hypothetical protein [Amphritea sp.]|uniref:hypothetical protein n=1 Tax=Amphritea sp. TaxID=1872502 RepID=UPI0025C38587|nr:hypothetical protein [Amphritea sp.]
MGTLQWVILAVVVMAGLGYWNYQRIDGQRKALEGAGFVVSDDLKGNPGLLVSTTQQQIAVLIPTGYLRVGFDQLKHGEIRQDASGEKDSNYRIALILNGASQSEVENRYQDEHQADSAFKKLRNLTSH